MSELTPNHAIHPSPSTRRLCGQVFECDTSKYLVLDQKMSLFGQLKKCADTMDENLFGAQLIRTLMQQFNRSLPVVDVGADADGESEKSGAKKKTPAQKRKTPEAEPRHNPLTTP